MAITVQFGNYAYATLTNAVGATATSFQITTGVGAVFPTLSAGQYYYLTLVDSGTNGTQQREIVKVNGVQVGGTGTITLTNVTRGQDGTSASAWGATNLAQVRVTNQGLIDIATQAAGGGAALLVANNLSELTATQATARANIGLGSASVLTAAQVCQTANNLSDVAVVATARTNLGLGSAAVLTSAQVCQVANNLSELTATQATARTNLGLGSAATFPSTGFLQPAGNLSEVSSAATSRLNLGLQNMSTQNANAVTITGGTAVYSYTNSGTGAVAVTNSSKFDKIIYLEDFGAAGDYNPATDIGTDDTTAIQNAFNAAVANTNGISTIRIRSKNYRVEGSIAIALVNTTNLRVEGEGVCGPVLATPTVGVGSCLYFRSITTGSGLRFNNATGAGISPHIELRNFAVIARTPLADNGILFFANSTSVIRSGTLSVISNVACLNWGGYPLRFIDTSNVVIENSTFEIAGGTGTGVVGMSCANIAGAFCGDLYFKACTFIGNGIGSEGIIIFPSNANASIRGLHFTQCVFYFGLHAVMVNVTAGGTAQDLFFTDCQFEGQNIGAGVNYGISLNAAAAGSTINSVQVSNCWFTGWFNDGIFSNTDGVGTIRSLVVNGCYFGQCLGHATNLTLAQDTIVSNNSASRCCNAVAGAAPYQWTNSNNFICTGNLHSKNGGANTAFYVVRIEASCTAPFTVANNQGQVGTAAINDLTGVITKTVVNNIFV